jgi:CheY-like chemotaxis protein
MQTTHIMVVEDEQLTALLLRSVLEHRGFRVTCAFNGAEALEHFAADPADLVVTDLKMPGMSGYDLIVALRRVSARLPIIVATGIVEHGAFQPNDIKVLHKPIDPGELLRTVAQLVS